MLLQWINCIIEIKLCWSKQFLQLACNPDSFFWFIILVLLQLVPLLWRHFYDINIIRRWKLGSRAGPVFDKLKTDFQKEFWKKKMHANHHSHGGLTRRDLWWHCDDVKRVLLKIRIKKINVTTPEVQNSSLIMTCPNEYNRHCTSKWRHLDGVEWYESSVDCRRLRIL